MSAGSGSRYIASLLTHYEIRTDAVFHSVARDANVGTTRAHSFSSCSQACMGSQTTVRGSAGQPGVKTRRGEVSNDIRLSPRHPFHGQAGHWAYPQAAGFTARTSPTVGLPAPVGPGPSQD